MGNDRVPDIPYTGGLKKLFEPIHDVPGDVNVGKKYKLKSVIATPRQWTLELQKVAKEGRYVLRVIVNGVLPPATDAAFTTLSSLTVTTVKFFDKHVILWVKNASGSVANLYFTDGEDKFQARPFADSVHVHSEALVDVRDEPILSPADIPDLDGDALKLSRVLKRVMINLSDVNKSIATRATAPVATQGRKRVAPTSACPPAPSREKGNRGKEPVAAAETSARDIVNTLADPAPGPQRENRAETPNAQATVASGQLPTGGGANIACDTPAVSQPSKRRKKQTARNQRTKDLAEINTTPTPGTLQVLETQFREDCGLNVEVPAPSKRKSRKRPMRHPKMVPEGQDIDIAQCQAELIQFKNRSLPMYIWGQDFTATVCIDNMIEAPKDFKYRPFHESLVDSLLQVFLTQLHANKQTITLIPASDTMPLTYEEAKEGEFYIINGQHSWAAAKRLIDSPDVSQDLKDDYSCWTCDFVWTEDKLLLSELARRTNNTNQFRWDSPEYLLHIQYARDLWEQYGKPTVQEKSTWKEFQAKAVETLNAMTFKNAYKSAKEYPGEFRVICAEDNLYKKIMQAFQWYESGDLVNPDTGSKWKDESSDQWVRKYTVAYTFKCLRGMGSESLAELVKKITEGLTRSGKLKPDVGIPPKVYLGQTRPKNKFCFSLKDWTDRKKAKNAVVRFLSRRCAEEIWTNDDVNVSEWRDFKRARGFNSVHMDELIRRATKKYLAKFMKVSDNPKREQEAPPAAFVAELSRVLRKDQSRRIDLAPLYSVYQKNGALTKFARMRCDSIPHDSAGIENDTGTWQAMDTKDMAFSGGVLDFRSVDLFLKRDDVAVKPKLGDRYTAYLQSFVEPQDFLTAPPYWLVIAHSNKKTEALKAMRKHLIGWNVLESRYVAANAETYFFSPTIIKKGNGVTIFLFTGPKAHPLVWGDQVRSPERYKRIGEVREYGMLDHELRMEVYLDFISQLPRSKSEVLDNVLCINTGRKCMIATVLCERRPVSVVAVDDCLDLYILSHKLGCDLFGFEHVFHTDVETDDVAGQDLWNATERAEATVSAEDSDDNVELRSKKNSDRQEISENSEGGSIEHDEVDQVTDDEGTKSAEESEEDIAQGEENCPSPTPATAGWLHTNDEYKRRRLPDAGTEVQTSQEVQSSQESPTSELYRRSQFASTTDFEEELLSDDLRLPMDLCPPAPSPTVPSPGLSLPSPPPVAADYTGNVDSPVGNCPLGSHLIATAVERLESPQQSVMVGSPIGSSVKAVALDIAVGCCPVESPVLAHAVDEVFSADPGEASPQQSLLVNTPFRSSVKARTDPETEGGTAVNPELYPVGNCPLATTEEPPVLEIGELLSVESTGDGIRPSALDGPLIEEIEHHMLAELECPRLVPVAANITVKAEQTFQPQLSNKDSPIIINSDSEDEMWRETVASIPSPADSELSEGPDEPPQPEGSERKVSQSKALRLQLRKIAQRKLATNKEARRYSRELEMQNKMLMKELEKERALREKEKMLREEANESLRSAGIAQVEYTSSPSAPLTHQATTSVASAPELSGSEAIAPSRPGEDDVIPVTQESVILEKFAAMTTDTTLQEK